MISRIGLFYLVAQTAYDVALQNPEISQEVISYLKPYMELKPKMYALCMGLHRRLGVHSPLRWLNADVIQEIAKHVLNMLCSS
jgi:hypothetical protein